MMNQISGAVTVSTSRQRNAICSGSHGFAFFGHHRFSLEADPATFAVTRLGRVWRARKERASLLHNQLHHGHVKATV